MVNLEQHERGVILPVRAHPGAKKTAIVGVHNGCLRVTVVQAPEKGKANQALIKALAELLGLKRSQFELVAGLTAGEKKFLISGVSQVDLRRRVDASLPPEKP